MSIIVQRYVKILRFMFKKCLGFMLCDQKEIWKRKEINHYTRVSISFQNVFKECAEKGSETT